MYKLNHWDKYSKIHVTFILLANTSRKLEKETQKNQLNTKKTGPGFGGF